jgi:hypothetical protein
VSLSGISSRAPTGRSYSLCTTARNFHWTHELFAVETAIRAIAEIGGTTLGDAKAEWAELLARMYKGERVERMTLTVTAR